MNRIIIIACLMLVAFVAQADEQKVYETDKFGNKLEQTHVIKDGKVHETDRFGNKLGQTHEIRGDKIYQTDKYGNNLGQAYEVTVEIPEAPTINTRWPARSLARSRRKWRAVVAPSTADAACLKGVSVGFGASDASSGRQR